MSSASARSLASSLDKLTISHGSQIPLKSKDTAPADSWEDEADSDTEKPNGLSSIPPSTKSTTRNLPSPPPPTPISPSTKTKASAFDSPYQTLPPFGMHGSLDSRDGGVRSPPPPQRSAGDAERRPEKTTATASRLIAAGIGQKAPRRTEEQRKYDQAVKVQEKKKRDAAKEAEQKREKELETAKKAIWDD